MRAPLKLVSCDAPDAAHTVAVLLAGAEPPFRTALIIGADTHAFAKALAAFHPHRALHEHEINPDLATGKLPFPDRSFDLVIDLDFLALQPGAQRPVLFRELVRVSDREVVAAEPLGTDLQLLIDRSLINLYRELFRAVHTELAHLVDYGLPNPQQAFSWLRHGEETDMFYAGDVVAYQATAEQLIWRKHQGWLRSLPMRLANHAHDQSDPSLRAPETVPRRRHRRMFLLLRRT